MSQGCCFRSVFRVSTMVLALSAFNLATSAQNAKVLAPHKPLSPRIENPYPFPSAVPGSMVGGPWIIDGNFKSAVYIKNGVETSAVSVTPTLYLSNGAAYTLSDVEVPPAGTTILDVGLALQKLGIAPYATLNGYVELKYNWPWDPICATIRNLDTTHSLIFSYSLHSSKPFSPTGGVAAATARSSRSVEGVWWKQEANVTGFVALANTTSQTLTVNVELSDDAGVSFSQQSTEISPHGTKTLSLSDLTSAKATAGGIRITYTGATTDLLVNGGLEDVGTGYSANLPFTTAPASNTPSTTTFAELGLMTGPADPMMHFPSGTTFTPYTVLRNISSSALTATPTFWWMAGGSPHSSQLSAISLSPYQSQALNVPALLAAAGLAAFSGAVQLAFRVQGNIGCLLMAGGSVDQNYTYVFEVTPHGISESASKSLSYWDTANGDDTMVTIWNPADQSQDFVFQITYPGGHYNYPVLLGAGATRTFNISEVAESGIPDPEGNVIPEGVHEGGAKLMGSSGDNEQILVAMDAGTYNVRKATCITYCETCNGVTGFSMSPGSFSIAPDGQTQLILYEVWNTGSEYDETSVSSWSTSNSGIATVGTSTDAMPGQVAGVSAGSVTISAKDPFDDPAYTSYWCEGAPWSCPYTYYSNGGSGATGTLADPTPVISGVSPASIDAGTTSQLILNGSGFGTNAPTLTFSPSTGITYSLTSYDDTEIIAEVTVAASTPTETLNVTVTSTGYNGQGFTGQQSPKSSSKSTTVQGAKVPEVTISISFKGTKSAGDNLSFTASTTDCTNNLGLQNCPSTADWEWNIEGRGVVTDDASKWTVNQSKVSGLAKGYYKNSSGYLQSFSVTIPAGADGPVSQALQQTSGQTTIYWIDGPAFRYTTSGYLVDSVTEVQNFTTKFCSTTSTNDCNSISWYVKIVVAPGAKLDTVHSKAGLGSVSTNF